MPGARSICAAMLLAVPTLAVGADAVPLPIAQPLDTDRLEIDLHRGRVDIVIDPGQAPTLRVTDLVRGDDTEGLILLDALSDGLILKQPHGSDELSPPLSIEVVLVPGQRIRVEGIDVAVSVRGAELPDGPAAPGPSTAEDEELAQPSRAPRTSITSGRTSLPVVLDLTGGSLTLEGVSDVHVSARGTGISLSRTIGEIDIAAADAVVNVREHRGPLLLGGERVEYELVDSRTVAVAQLDEGLLSVNGGDGRIMLGGVRSDLLVAAWTGTIAVRGDEHRVEVRESGTASETISIDGADHDLTLDGWSGDVQATLTGGRLDVRRIGGRVKIDAREGTSARVVEVADELNLKLADGASVNAEEIGRRLIARLDDARLDIVGAREIDLKAERSVVVVAKIFGRTKIELSNSEGDLDFTGIHASPHLEAQGSTSARVIMSQPCSVRGIQRDNTFAERATITGCQVLTTDQRRPVIRSRSSAPPTVLILSLDEDAAVDVRNGF